MRGFRKLTWFLLSIIPITILTSVILFIINSQRYIVDSRTAFREIVTSAHKYAVVQVQDIDILNHRILTNPKSKSDYVSWLNAMGAYKSITLKPNNVTNTASQANDDEFFKSYVTDILKNDMLVSGRYAYTPLNAGITYLDRELYESDVENYIIRYINEIDKKLSWNRNFGYRYDPNHIDVKVTMKATPINVKDLTTSSEKDVYLQLFGLNSDTEADRNVIKLSDSSTIVKYEIQVDVKYEIVVDSVFTKIPPKDLIDIEDLPHPPSGIFTPGWYMQDGSVNPVTRNKIQFATRNLTTTDYHTYNFEYILTN